MSIAISQKDWAHLKKWAIVNKEDPDTVRRREYVKFLNHRSAEMKKYWPNSVENINKRNEELRLQRLGLVEQANAKFYKKHIKQKRKEQEELMQSARDAMFKSKDAPKMLLSAVLETAVQKERIEQLNFLHERRREEAEIKRKNDDQILQQAKEWHKLMALREKRRFEVNKKHQREILEQAREIAERNRNEYETEVSLQKIDNIRADEEMKALREFEAEYKEKETRRLFNDMNQAKMERDARKRQQESRDLMDDRLIEVLNKSRARIDRKRKQTELEAKNERLRLLEMISAKLKSGDTARDAKEQAILDKDIKEKRSNEDARMHSDQRKSENLRQERMESREQFLRDENQRLQEFDTQHQFEVINRFKNCELYEEFKEGLKKEKARKTKEYRDNMLKLWKERKDREDRELAETRYFYGERTEKKTREADNKLFTHAAYLLEEAKRLGRPQLPLHKAIDKYCKLNHLYPMPPLYEPIAEHMRHYIPRDRSRLDFSYVEPPPPPSMEQKTNQSGSKDQLYGGLVGNNGLKDSVECGRMKSTNSKPDKNPFAANGLQMRESKTTIEALPPITAIQCKSSECKCESKPYP